MHMVCFTRKAVASLHKHSVLYVCVCVVPCTKRSGASCFQAPGGSIKRREREAMTSTESGLMSGACFSLRLTQSEGSSVILSFEASRIRFFLLSTLQP